MSSVQPIDLLVLCVYFTGIAAAGLWFARRNKSTEHYFLGSRNFPAWAIGLSLVGTSISSVSFLAYPGDAFKTAYLRLLPAFVLPIAILIASHFFLPFFRRGKVTSAFEYLEGRFGPYTRVYAAVAFIVSQLLRLSTILFLVSVLIFEFVMGLVGPENLVAVFGEEYQAVVMYLCVVLAGIFVSFYTVLGGIEAVVWTDVVQTIVLIGGGILCLAIIVWQLPGGLGQIISDANAAGKFSFSDLDPATGIVEDPEWRFTFYRRTALMMLVIGMANWLMEYSSNQNVVQRYCASRSAADARRAMWICCWTSIPLWTFFMFLGTALWVYYQQFPTETSEMMLRGDLSAEQVLPHFILSALPWGFGGLLVAAVLAAAMSSLDSSINAIATVSVTDIYKRHLFPGREDTHYLWAARAIAIVSSVLMVLGAFLFVTAQQRGAMQTMQDTSVVLAALTSGGLLGLYMFGFFTKIGDDRSLITAIILTIAFNLYRTLHFIGVLPEFMNIGIIDSLDHYYTGVLGHILVFVAAFVFATAFHAFLRRPKRDLTNLTVWTQDGKPLD